MKRYYYTMLMAVSLVAAAIWQLRPGAAIYQQLPAFLHAATPGQALQDGGEPERIADGETGIPEGSETVPEQETSGSMNASQTASDDAAESTKDMQNAVESSTQTEQANSGSADAQTSTQPQLSQDSGVAASAQQEQMPLPPADFAGVLFIGDSRTVGLSEYGNLGQAEVFADTGLTVFKLFKEQVKVKNVGQTDLTSLLSTRQYQMIYLMLGINEIGYPQEQLAKQYRAVVEQIRALQPNAKLVLCANLHVTAEKSAANPTYNNARLDALNASIHQLAKEEGCGYVDANRLFDDGAGNLAKEYSTDGAHPMGKYYARWSQWLKDGVI